MKDPRSYENYIIRLVIVALALTLGFFGSKFVGNIYESNLVKSYAAPMNEMNDNLRETIASQTDAYKAAGLGMSFLKSQNNDLALLAFTKSTELDPKYRDAWVWRGYTEIKLNNGQKAVESLKTAEKIDPVNAKTYELLKAAYELTGNQDEAIKAGVKWEYLTKTK